MSDKSTPPSLTVREQKMLAQAMQCLESELKIDTDKFAALTGLAPGSAKNLWYALRKKLSSGGGAVPATPKKGTAGASSASGIKKSPVVKKRGARVMNAETDDDDDEDDDVAARESPSEKTPKKTKSTRAKAKGKEKVFGKSLGPVEGVKGVKREPEE